MTASTRAPIRRRPPCPGRVACLVAAALACTGAADRPPAPGLAEFLSARGIDRAARAALEADGPWDDAKERLLVRVLARLGGPASLECAWRGAADQLPAQAAVAVSAGLVRGRGRAVFVAPRDLPPELARLAGRPAYDLVRLVDEQGAVVDVAVPRAPRAWPRWNEIGESASVTGLPLTVGAGPVPATAGRSWPTGRHDLLLAATAVAWHPDTLLGRLGMDYGLFDAVVDGRKLEPGDADAFHAVLAAAGRTGPGEIAAAAGSRADVLPLIDPRQGWFERHRGDPVAIAGVCRSATRITVDDDWRRTEVDADHYWQLVVFVDTPPLEVDGRVQDRYPIVCCVRELPVGMPTGESISEAVRVAGFAFKRYSYPLSDAHVAPPASAGGAGGRIVTPLLIGREVVRGERPGAARAGDPLVWPLAIGGVVAAGLIAWNLRLGRQHIDRRRRARLPERIQMPPER